MPLPNTWAERIAIMAKNAIVDITTRWDRPAVAIGRGETYLVVTLTTARPKKNSRRPAVDISFVIDRSGSMTGLPLDLAKQGVITALDQLNDGDGVAVVAYDHLPMTVGPLVPATSTQRAQLVRTLREMETGGSTNLFGGWQLGCEHLTHPEFGIAGRIRRTILLTDGLANVGLVDPQQISWQVARQRQAGITTSTLGLGTGIDETLLAGMAEAGGGNFAFVEYPKGLPAFFARELGEALSVVASSSALTLTLPKGVRARLLNPFPTEREGKRLSIALGDLPAGMVLDLVFSITTRAKTVGAFSPLESTAEWKTAGTDNVSQPASERVTVPIDALMAVSPADFTSMPRDEKASDAVAHMIADNARRTALQHFRTGDLSSARSVLASAQSFAAAAPLASPELIGELGAMMDFDPASQEFQLRSRQIENDAHRRSRGRNI
jgi:Ca-activated chloride channel homolog